MAKTILIIDDDPEVVRLLQTAMKDEGYAVVTGHDGQMALNLARTHKPSLMIMDVQMPMTSGLKSAGISAQNTGDQRHPDTFPKRSTLGDDLSGDR